MNSKIVICHFFIICFLPYDFSALFSIPFFRGSWIVDQSASLHKGLNGPHRLSFISITLGKMPFSSCFRLEKKSILIFKSSDIITTLYWKF